LEDRFAGVVEMPFDSFVPGDDVPWHRIRRFRCGPVVAWDRVEKIDRLETLRLTPSPTARGDPQRFATKARLLEHLSRPNAVAWALVQASREYPSFVEEIVVSTTGHTELHLVVEWRSYAMDWMGDATNVCITYRFASADVLIDEVERRLGVSATDYSSSAPPLPESAPLANDYPASLVPVFQDAWRRLKVDFAAGKLLLPDLEIVSRFEGW
jgi:hypothetical protein